MIIYNNDNLNKFYLFNNINLINYLNFNYLNYLIRILYIKLIFRLNNRYCSISEGLDGLTGIAAHKFAEVSGCTSWWFDYLCCPIV